MIIEHLGRGERRFVLPRMDAVHRTDIHARGVLRTDTRLTNNIRHYTYYYNRSNHETPAAASGALRGWLRCRAWRRERCRGAGAALRAGDARWRPPDAER